jgi:hypothetical protein
MLCFFKFCWAFSGAHSNRIISLCLVYEFDSTLNDAAHRKPDLLAIRWSVLFAAICLTDFYHFATTGTNVFNISARYGPRFITGRETQESEEHWRSRQPKIPGLFVHLSLGYSFAIHFGFHDGGCIYRTIAPKLLAMIFRSDDNSCGTDKSPATVRGYNGSIIKTEEPTDVLLLDIMDRPANHPFQIRNHNPSANVSGSAGAGFIGDPLEPVVRGPAIVSAFYPLHFIKEHKFAAAIAV